MYLNFEKNLVKFLDKPTLTVVGIFAITTYVMLYFQQYGDELAPGACQKRDALWEYYGEKIEYGVIADLMTVLTPVICFVAMSLNSAESGPVVLRRYLLILSLLYFFRTWALLLTMEPSIPDNSVRFVENKFLGALEIMFGMEQTFTDLMYSGHTCVFVLSFMTYFEYNDRKEWFPFSFYVTTGIYLLYITIGILLTILAHIHYTVDCYIAALLTVMIFKIYHLHIKLQQPRPFVAWLDGGIATNTCKTDYRKIVEILD